jgi:hypothetical protein
MVESVKLRAHKYPIGVFGSSVVDDVVRVTTTRDDDKHRLHNLKCDDRPQVTSWNPYAAARGHHSGNHVPEYSSNDLKDELERQCLEEIFHAVFLVEIHVSCIVEMVVAVYTGQVLKERMR